MIKILKGYNIFVEKVVMVLVYFKIVDGIENLFKIFGK